MSAVLRAGVIGLGMMGRHHARVLHALDGVELVAVADEVGDRLGAAQGAPVVGSVDELLRVGIDVAVVATPTATHEEVGLRLASAGVHTLIEKPVAVDAAAAARLVAAFDRAGLVGAVGHIERYNAALQALRQRLDAGELGDVFQIATRRQGPFPDRIADVGVVKDLATHDIDVTTWIARSPYASISAHATTKSGRLHEDLVAVSGRLEDGTVTSHLVNWLSPFKERVVVVTGARGAYVADTLTADLTFHENGTERTSWDQLAAFRGVAEGGSTRFAIPKREPLVLEHEAFRDAVLGRRQDVVTLADGMRTVAVADRVITSARTGTVSIVDHAAAGGGAG
ncbi:Gfo/Idh/MocA family oxidoreductase [Curtobacterium citreum]|uniref:Gfo/Idh/MocA family protein n=1 Tax=Curtobacterium citreum TaxID=2036 RepID=UPI0027E25F16|nr:Gfo/Idh/MocA family oxidoreductase [Curtobacterium albidum]